MTGMKKIFADSEEKLLKAGVVYYNSTDSILYYNKTEEDNTTKYSNEVSKADLINLFNKGLLIVDDGTYFIRPSVLTVADDYASVSYDESVFYSDGYTADDDAEDDVEDNESVG